MMDMKMPKVSEKTDCRVQTVDLHSCKLLEILQIYRYIDFKIFTVVHT